MNNMYEILARLDQVDKPQLTESQDLGERITKDMTAGEVISDFIASDDPKFQGKSREERRKMALGAYYGMHPEKSRREGVEETQDLSEKWDTETQVSPSEKGKYAGQTKAELLKKYRALKKSGPHARGSDEYGRMRELAFAIRAKSDWGKVAEGDIDPNRHPQTKDYGTGEPLDDPGRQRDREQLATDVKTLNRLEKQAVKRGAQMPMDEADLDEVSRGGYIRQQDAQAERSGKKSFQAFGQEFNTDEVKESKVMEAAKKEKAAWPGTPEYREKTGTQTLGDFRKKYAGSVMRDPKSREELAKLDTEYEAGKGRYGKEEEPDDEEGKKTAKPAGEKRGRGRPKGTKRAIGAKGPTGRSKLMTREDYDRDEYDEEGEMAKSFLRTIEDAAKELQSILGDDENLPEWVQKKITLAYDYLDTARDYMKANPAVDQDRDMAMEVDTGEADARRTTPSSKEHADEVFARHRERANKEREDQRAEKAGREVAKDIEYDEKVKDKIHGKKRGAEDDKAERAGKKVAKDIEHDEEVKETTTAGSVATAPAESGKKSKGGMQFGKGIYEGQLEESFQAQLAREMGDAEKLDEGVNVTMTVSATDDEAMALSQMLKMAGLFQSQGYKKTCGVCGGLHEGDCRVMEEDLANSADNTETMSMDYMVNDLAGGLNGPKKQVNPNNMADNPLAMPDLGKGPYKQINLESIAEEVEQDDQQRLLDLYRKIS